MENSKIRIAERLLKELDCSLVIIDRYGNIRTFYNKGVKDLFVLFTRDPDFMKGAVVADKLVGAGAAALIALGEVAELFTFLISTPAKDRLKKARIKCEFTAEVPNIQNRYKTGICPVENLVAGVTSDKECYRLIAGFLTAQGLA